MVTLHSVGAGVGDNDGGDVGAGVGFEGAAVGDGVGSPGIYVGNIVGATVGVEVAI